MTEHPINLKSWEVRAILDGRKTMTRRVLKPQPVPFRLGADGSGPECEVSAVTLQDEKPRIALGRVITAQNATRWAPGDRLWVREGFALVGTTDPGFLLYRANGYEAECNRHGFDRPYPPETKVHWRSSAVMPRWASRITLLVTDVRVERLQDISEADAVAEGVNRPHRVCEDDGTSYTDGFAQVWDELYGPDAWERNDWVSVTKFERVT